MWKLQIDQYTWYGRAIKATASAPKVAVVLLFFTGIFAVIAVDSLVLRLKNRSVPKRIPRA